MAVGRYRAAVPPNPLRLDPHQPPPHLRVVSFDGMSAAALQVRLLRAYEERCPGFLASVDVFTGASDGGYTALYLAANVTDDHEQNLKVVDDAIAFSNNMIPLFHLRLIPTLKFLTGWWPLLEGGPFRDYFQQAFGDRTLADLQRHLLVVTFGSRVWRPRVLTTIPMAENKPNPFPPDKVTLWEAALATSALPVVLPTTVVGDGRFVDGGLVANNAAWYAISQISAYYRCECPTDEPPSMGLLDGLRVLRLGSRVGEDGHDFVNRPGRTGLRNKLYSRPDWGWLQWIVLRPFLLSEMMLQGSIDTAEDGAAALLGPARYHQISPTMPQIRTTFDLAMGIPSRLVSELDEVAAKWAGDEEFMTRHATWIETRFMHR